MLGYVAAHPMIALAVLGVVAVLAIQAFMDATDDEFWL